MDERIRSVKGFGRFLLLVGSLLLLVTAYVQGEARRGQMSMYMAQSLNSISYFIPRTGHSGEPLQLISEVGLETCYVLAECANSRRHLIDDIADCRFFPLSMLWSGNDSSAAETHHLASRATEAVSERFCHRGVPHPLRPCLYSAALSTRAIRNLDSQIYTIEGHYCSRTTNRYYLTAMRDDTGI